MPEKTMQVQNTHTHVHTHTHTNKYLSRSTLEVIVGVNVRLE